jgi:hypothetical protein
MYQANCGVDYVDEFWCNSSDIPAIPPRLAIDCDDSFLDTTIGGQLLDSSGSMLMKQCPAPPISNIAVLSERHSQVTTFGAARYRIIGT